MRAFWRVPVIGPWVFSLWLADARRKADWIRPWLPADAPLLEIGSGPGSVVRVLRDRRFNVEAIDIADSSYDDTLQPRLYDGLTLPYSDRSFGAALVLTVLHHTPDPDAVLREAARVASRVIVIEDIYTSPFHRKLTKAADSVTNLEFFGHPHSNRDDAGWRATFEALGFTLDHASTKPYVGAFLQALYVLKSPAEPADG